MKNQESRDTPIAFCFFDVGARWVWVFTPCPNPFSPRKEARYLLCRSLVGTQSRSG